MGSRSERKTCAKKRIVVDEETGRGSETTTARKGTGREGDRTKRAAYLTRASQPNTATKLPKNATEVQEGAGSADSERVKDDNAEKKGRRGRKPRE